MQETQVQSLGWEDSLKEEMATHSNIFAWRFPWTEELSMGCKELDTTEHTCTSVGATLDILVRHVSEDKYSQLKFRILLPH